MSALITTLAPDEVFIYGSNSTGFSGAGAAGLAVRGTAANTWREDPWVARARSVPVGHPDRIGKWAVWGVARGWSRGREGMGYAIETIERPGLKRSVSLSTIHGQLWELFGFAHFHHPEWWFLMTAVGSSRAGYTDTEMADTFNSALGGFRLHMGVNTPVNLVIPEGLYGRAADSWSNRTVCPPRR